MISIEIDKLDKIGLDPVIDEIKEKFKYVSISKLDNEDEAIFTFCKFSNIVCILLLLFVLSLNIIPTILLI